MVETGNRVYRVLTLWGNQQPTGPSKQPIRNRYLGHVTGDQPIRDQYFLILTDPLECHIAALY